jgi:hypothetical protein
MRKLSILLVSLFLLNSCAEKIYLFDAKISSKDINGSPKFGPKNSDWTSVRIKDPLNPQKEYSFLGRLIGSDRIRRHNDFIDLIFLKGNYGAIDSVYVNFLDEAIIPNFNIASTTISSGKWNRFKSDFEDVSSFSDKKNVMFKTEHLEIRNELQKSIYTTLSNQIKQTQKIERIFKSGLDANIKAVLKESSRKVYPMPSIVNC